MADVSYAGQFSAVDPDLQARNIGLIEEFFKSMYGTKQVPKLDADGNPVLDPNTGEAVMDTVTDLTKRGPLYPEIPAITSAPADYFQNEVALDMGEELRRQKGIGQYKPFLERGSQLLTEGADAMRGIAGAYDPSSVDKYMDPYQQQVIDATMSELNRQGNLARSQAAAQAVGAGAFGGTREGVQRAELDRNLADVKSRALADLYSRGFSQAQAASREDFADLQRRREAMARGIGTFGEAQQRFGEAAQRQGLADYQAQLGIGAMRRDIEQKRLDADRATKLQQQMFPYQQVGFMQDLIRGVPTSMSTLTSTTSPGGNPFLQTAATGANLALSTAALGQSFPSLFGTGG